MSTPEQPDTPPLTRRRMRDLRNTGSNPIIAVPEAGPAPVAAVPFVPLARAAEPVAVPEPPAPDASVDLGVAPLTRRQARQQERIRTASVPVITPEVAAAHAARMAPIDSVPVAGVGLSPSVEQFVARHPEPAAPTLEDLFGVEDVQVVVEDVPRTAAMDASGIPSSAFAPVAADPVVDAEIEPDPFEMLVRPAAAEDERELSREAERTAGEPVVSPRFGSDLLEADLTHVVLPPSFDQLISRPATASGSTPKSLIVAQDAGSSAIVAPVAATGEVLITGTFNLPEGLGSLGHVPGTADGKEVDAVLVDGELPAHSSPTPIAASAAISTVKTAGEIIKPPVPEKGNKLMVSLAITAGILAAALLAVLTVAMISGVF